MSIVQMDGDVLIKLIHELTLKGLFTKFVKNLHYIWLSKWILMALYVGCTIYSSECVSVGFW